MELQILGDNCQYIEDLKTLFRVCFQESEEAIRCFFEHRFQKENCVVLIKDYKVVSALYLLETRILLEGELISAYYLYAAATLPEYQGRGYMRKLIAFSNTVAAARGWQYSVLLPANDGLYHYYKQSGYQKWYATRVVTITSKEMKKYVSVPKKQSNTFSFDKMYQLRFNICGNFDGSVIWDEKAIEYACLLSDVYKGKTIFSKDGYALCSPVCNGVVTITEFMVQRSGFCELMGEIVRAFPDVCYRFRMPVSSPYFKGQGAVLPFGMVKPLYEDKGLLIEMQKNNAPYLGLTLD